MTEPVLEISDVVAGYQDTEILNNMSFSVTKGERLAIIGRNGVGKSTLLNTLMGLTDLHSGTIALNGAAIDALPAHLRAARGLGLVPQTRDIFTSLTVEENLLAGQVRGGTLAYAFEMFPQLLARRRNGGGQLSGGEQQMLSIARTLMGRPEVLLLDEPLEGLAPVICDMLMAVFEKLASDGEHTIVLVEQHAEVALEFSQRMLIVDNGAVVFDGPTEKVRKDRSILERHVGLGIAAG
jgi:branched-chain amino acid transport system ATP-binding protein